MRIAVTGSTGMIGTALVGQLKAEGHTVLRLVRRKPNSAEEVQWDPAAGTIDLAALEGVDAVIHLAGAGVGDKRWTPKYRATILNSRLLGTTTIANAVTALKPKVFISASAIGFYGETGNRALGAIIRARADDKRIALDNRRRGRGLGRDKGGHKGGDSATCMKHGAQGGNGLTVHGASTVRIEQLCPR